MTTNNPIETSPPQPRTMRRGNPLAIGGSEVGLCLTRIHHDRFTEATPVDDPVRERQVQIGFTHEDAVLTALCETSPGTIEHISSSGTDAYHDTRAALDRGADLILGGRIISPDGTLIGAPDILVRLATGYVAVEVKAHLVVGTSGLPARFTPLDALGTISFDPGVHDHATVLFRGNRRRDLYQAAHYWRILDLMGYATDHPIGGVIGTEDPYGCAWVDLDAEPHRILDGTINRTELALDAVHHGAEHPEAPLVAPWWRTECRSCPWMTLCHDALVEADDPTLLDQVSDVTRTLLTRHDIGSISAIAALVPGDERVESSSIVHQARARTYGGLLRRPGVRAPMAVPSPARQVDFDIETYLGRIYLAGFLITEDGESVFDPVVDWDGTEASEREFITRLFDRLASYADRDTNVFHWTGYESKCLGEAGRRLGLTVAGFDTVEDWFGTHAIDLYRWTKDRFVSPSGYSLKVIAPLCGFSWRDEDPGGQQSELWFEDLVGGDTAMKQRLLEYNEDDVAAQLAIRRWVTSQDNGGGAGSAIPSAETWPIPPRDG